MFLLERQEVPNRWTDSGSRNIRTVLAFTRKCHRTAVTGGISNAIEQRPQRLQIYRYWVPLARATQRLRRAEFQTRLSKDPAFDRNILDSSGCAALDPLTDLLDRLVAEIECLYLIVAVSRSNLVVALLLEQG